MRLPLFIIITIFAMVLPSYAQQQVAELRVMPAKPDTALNLLHADRLTTHNNPQGGQHLVIEGNVEVQIEEYHIKADRVEYDTDTISLVATGHVVVTTSDEVIRGERFEWKRSRPVAPVTDPE